MTKIKLEDLAIANFDQIVEIEEIKGGRRRGRTTSSYSYPSFKSVTTWWGGFFPGGRYPRPQPRK